MSHNRPPVPVIVVVVLILLSAAAYYLLSRNQPAENGALTASGSVESVKVSIAPELAGKVVEVLVDEGDAVSAGDVLFRLDDTVLKVQAATAGASLDCARSAAATAEAAAAAAQAQSDLALYAALTEEKAARTAGWEERSPTEFDQPAWYFVRSEQVSAFESEISSAQTALTQAQDGLKFVEEKATSAGFLDAEQRLAAARAAFQMAGDVLEKTRSTDADLRDAAQAVFDDAKSDLEDAQETYTDVVTSEGALDVLQARAELSVAQERLDLANDRLRTLQTGASSPKVTAAQKVVEQAQAASAQAQTAIRLAEANLALIEAQMAKLTVSAPSAGVVLMRAVEPGEVVNPGAVVLTLGRLSDLTITVYVPEDRYGEISLGQTARVTADSFPGESFTAAVSRIADQAEFTPRNVQTVEGRKTTVFAITLRLDDPEGKLKPGMPADVVFGE